MMSIEMARTAVGRTTIECYMRWCTTRCAGSDKMGRVALVDPSYTETSVCCCAVRAVEWERLNGETLGFVDGS